MWAWNLQHLQLWNQRWYLFPALNIPGCTKWIWHCVLVCYCCCNKLPQTCGLKQCTFTLLWFWKSEVWNQFHWRKSRCQKKKKKKIKVSGPYYFLSTGEALRENPFPCLFQFLEWLFLHSLAHCPFLHLQSQQHIICFSFVRILVIDCI